MKLIEPVKRHRYELIALLTGAAVMMLEIVGARLVAPYFGTSTYVWTAMIGVILGALSAGFWYGGKLADRDEPGKHLGVIIAAAGLLVLIMTFVQRPVLEQIAGQKIDLRLSAVLAAIALFGVPSFLIGMVSPHLAKIRVTSLQTTGTAIGRLEAAGALGSIAGTFLCGYVLLAFLGARNLSIWLAILLVFTSLLAGWRTLFKLRLGVIVVALLLLLYNPLPAGMLSDSDSAYSRYLVREGSYQGRPANILVMDSFSLQSAVYPDEPYEPAFPYIGKMFAAAQSFGSPEKVLVIGGGAHTLPSIIQHKLPGTAIDVVEIDASLLQLSEQFFGFTKGPKTNLFYEDGRSFLNRSENSYDLIFVDAFSSLTPPFQLTTKEAVERMRANLSPGGAIVINAPAAYDGEFLPSLIKTYGSVFDSVSLYMAREGRLLASKQNFMIVAAQIPEPANRAAEQFGQPTLVPSGGMVLTDDYAPVERLSY